MRICAGCGAVHAIPIKQASIKARRVNTKLGRNFGVLPDWAVPRI